MKEGQKWIDLPAGVTNQIAKDFGVTKRYVLMALDYTRNGKKAKMLRQVALQRGGKILMATPSYIKIEKNLDIIGKIDSFVFTISENKYMVFPSDSESGIMLSQRLYNMYLESIEAAKKE